jgi:hypothetical protein
MIREATKRFPPKNYASLFVGRQIQQPRLWNAFGDDQSGEVHPVLTMVEHDTVGCGDDLAGNRNEKRGLSSESVGSATAFFASIKTEGCLRFLSQ